MQGAAVGLYCAVVDRFDLLVSTRTIAARETLAVFDQRAENLRPWLGALNLGLVQAWQCEPENAREAQWGPCVSLPIPRDADA
jgi:hypothetical protein